MLCEQGQDLVHIWRPRPPKSEQGKNTFFTSGGHKPPSVNKGKILATKCKQGLRLTKYQRTVKCKYEHLVEPLLSHCLWLGDQFSPYRRGTCHPQIRAKSHWKRRPQGRPRELASVSPRQLNYLECQKHLRKYFQDNCMHMHLWGWDWVWVQF